MAREPRAAIHAMPQALPLLFSSVILLCDGFFKIFVRPREVCEALGQ